MSGKSAFPEIFDDGEAINSRPSISLRDYFAAAALQGIIACSPPDIETFNCKYDVKLAYKYADAMLDKREGGADTPSRVEIKVWLQGIRAGALDGIQVLAPSVLIYGLQHGQWDLDSWYHIKNGHILNGKSDNPVYNFQIIDLDDVDKNFVSIISEPGLREIEDSRKSNRQRPPRREK